jgi:hypothetical protein
LPRARLRCSQGNFDPLLVNIHDRDSSIGTAFGTDAAADAAFGNVDLTIGMTGDSGPAAKHTHRVLTLTAGRGDADIVDDHSLAVHPRMAVSSLACLFTFIAMNALVQINNLNFRALDDAIAHQRMEPLMCLWGRRDGLRQEARCGRNGEGALDGLAALDVGAQA